MAETAPLASASTSLPIATLKSEIEGGGEGGREGGTYRLQRNHGGDISFRFSLDEFAHRHVEVGDVGLVVLLVVDLHDLCVRRGRREGGWEGGREGSAF